MAQTKKVAKEKVTLEVQPREVFGKKVNQLRKQGLIPANIFGNNYDSKAISMPTLDFMAAYKVVRETGILYINVGKESVPTLISHVQLHPITDQILHVDFRKVNMKEKIETAVPVVFVGESEAVKTHNGVLITQSEYLYVEALPSDLPQQIEVDISKLVEIGDSISIADLTKPEGYVFTEEPEKVIVSVTAHREESTEIQSESEAPEITTAVEGEESAEGGDAAQTGGGKEEKSE